MKYRANVTYIIRHIDEFVKTVTDSTKVKDVKYTYGEFDDDETAEIVEFINHLLMGWRYESDKNL